MKAYTDIEQSKKLAKILPLESADMCYRYYSGDMITGYGDCALAKSFITGKNVIRENDLPCWSLAALISILPQIIEFKGDKYYLRFTNDYVEYANDEISIAGRYLHTTGNDNLVDACVEMIIKLVDACCLEMTIKLKELNLKKINL